MPQRSYPTKPRLPVRTSYDRLGAMYDGVFAPFESRLTNEAIDMLGLNPESGSWKSGRAPVGLWSDSA